MTHFVCQALISRNKAFHSCHYADNTVPASNDLLASVYPLLDGTYISQHMKIIGNVCITYIFSLEGKRTSRKAQSMKFFKWDFP